jgi:rhamnogalacturonan acetylesterase
MPAHLHCIPLSGTNSQSLVPAPRRPSHCSGIVSPMSRSISIRNLFLLFLLASVLTPAIVAQTPEALPILPSQTTVPTDQPLNPALPTVFIVGDSTARNNADLGWGDHFAHLFDTTRINIANRATAGRSSRSYYNEGRWEKVLAEIKPGDFVLLQMGHNDGAYTPATIASETKGRGSLKGTGNETADIPLRTPFTTGPLAGQTTETVHTYGWYIRKYIADTKAKGAIPILLTPTIRNIWIEGHIERDMGFRDFDTQIAAAEHIQLVDMASVAASAFEKLGKQQTALLFPIDHTHTSPEGAELNAGFVAQALRNAHSPVAAYLKPQPA